MGRRTVLVIEDDPSIRRGLVDTLECAGYATLESGEGKEALGIAVTAEIDLALVDVMLPGLDGFTLVEEIRLSKPALPLIMVTAKGAEAERVKGLKSGADDYVVKPFSAMELLARVEAVLRRSAERPTEVGSIDLDGRTIDFDTREVALPDGSTCELSQKEADLLRYLAHRRGRPIARDELLQRVWGIDPRGVETRTIDMHIARLREKLADPQGDQALIRTVRGKGYQLA